MFISEQTELSVLESCEDSAFVIRRPMLLSSVGNGNKEKKYAVCGLNASYCCWALVNGLLSGSLKVCKELTRFPCALVGATGQTRAL